MKKMRNALFALVCMTGMLTACGESPVAPVSNVDLVGAEAKKSTTTTTTTTTENSKTSTTSNKLPTNRSDGYVLGM